MMVIERNFGVISSVLGSNIKFFHKFEISSLPMLNLHQCNKNHEEIAGDTDLLHIW